jgi:DNA-3-methyladenine glycosylase
LCSSSGGIVKKVRITETEAYFGESDTACHARRGKTPRTEIMYRRGGYAYIYLCYGIHHLLNIVSGPEGNPEAALIRGGIGYNGPGKLTKGMRITTGLNGEDLSVSDRLWLEDDGFIAQIKETKRIGIEYATEEYRNKLWRFAAAD